MIQRDTSPGTAAAVLPWLRRIAAATKGTKEEVGRVVLANALVKAGHWREAEAMMRDIMPQAAARGELRTAVGIAGYLINILGNTGRAGEALDLVEEKKNYTRRASLGPWTQLTDEGQRLQLLNTLGRYEEVLSAVEELREQMRTLPEESGQEEAAIPWNVRETILDIGGFAAMRLERWEAVLALNAERVASQEARGAPALEVARARFNDYSLLLRLGRYKEARTLLHTCRAIYEQEGAIPEMGRIFGALADLEDTLGHSGQAIAFAETALRYGYLAGAPEDCAINHFNLANYLIQGEEPPEAALTHRLAAMVVFFQTGSGVFETHLRFLTYHLASFAPDPPLLPASFDELCRMVEAVEGVRFRELFERLPRRAATGDEALREVLKLAQEIDS